jgi:hypothetical protein
VGGLRLYKDQNFYWVKVQRDICMIGLGPKLLNYGVELGRIWPSIARPLFVRMESMVTSDP